MELYKIKEELKSRATVRMKKFKRFGTRGEHLDYIMME